MGIKVEGCASEVGIHSKDDREVGREQGCCTNLFAV